MAEYVICEKSELTAVADAVRAKTGTNESLKLTEIPNTLGDTKVKEKGIKFYDYDGTLLYSYTVEEFASATNLPPLPSQAGLICQGWNWSLEDIKAMNREVNVGAMYITDDGSTRLYIHLEEGYTSPMLGLGVKGTVTIDWGDGSEPDILTGTSTNTIKYTSNHEYGIAGDYVITLIIDGKIGFLGDYQSGSCILKYSSSINTQNLKYCSFLQKIEIGNNISINNYAFRYCKNLTFITIPNSVTSMESWAFAYCHNLTSITIPNGVTSIRSYAFQYCHNLTSITIPNGVTSIESYAFYHCHSLTFIIIPDSITSINDDAFAYCYNLTSITIPNSITSIKGWAFQSCYNLTSITIPNSVTNIEKYAFQNCYNLTSITIPNDVTSIESYTFSYCYNMCFYDFTSHTTVPTLSATNAFSGNQTGCEIRVPAALYDEWIAATNWSTYASYIVGV